MKRSPRRDAPSGYTTPVRAKATASARLRPPRRVPQSGSSAQPHSRSAERQAAPWPKVCRAPLRAPERPAAHSSDPSPSLRPRAHSIGRPSALDRLSQMHELWRDQAVRLSHVNAVPELMSGIDAFLSEAPRFLGSSSPLEKALTRIVLLFANHYTESSPSPAGLLSPIHTDPAPSPPSPPAAAQTRFDDLQRRYDDLQRRYDELSANYERDSRFYDLQKQELSALRQPPAAPAPADAPAASLAPGEAERAAQRLTAENEALRGQLAKLLRVTSKFEQIFESVKLEIFAAREEREQEREDAEQRLHELRDRLSELRARNAELERRAAAP